MFLEERSDVVPLRRFDAHVSEHGFKRCGIIAGRTCEPSGAGFNRPSTSDGGSVRLTALLECLRARVKDPKPRSKAMVDVDKHVAYWREGAQEDGAVAAELVGRRRARHGLFFAHWALEKALKAHVTRHTRDVAPRIHNRVRLAEIAELRPSQETLDTLADMNAFSQAGRYPDTLPAAPSQEETDAYLARVEKVFQWLINQL